MLLLLVALVCQSASGFSVAAPAPAINKQQRATRTQLNAWSLPVTNKFGTFSTSWFDVKDPTGRKVVYNDDTHE